VITIGCAAIVDRVLSSLRNCCKRFRKNITSPWRNTRMLTKWYTSVSVEQLNLVL